ncbi:hypothetical protein GJ496_010065 [Pomphorhynchus laevis]|nr:hypothetical protein GJ496_010065 [Pomphorhynchus laevis]
MTDDAVLNEGDESQRSVDVANTSAAGEEQRSSPSSETDTVNKAGSTTGGVEEGAAADKKVNYRTLPTRAYLDQTVVPILLQAMSQLARERPEKPIEFLAQFLLNHRKSYGETE